MNIIEATTILVGIVILLFAIDGAIRKKLSDDVFENGDEEELKDFKFHVKVRGREVSITTAELMECICEGIEENVYVKYQIFVENYQDLGSFVKTDHKWLGCQIIAVHVLAWLVGLEIKNNTVGFSRVMNALSSGLSEYIPTLTIQELENIKGSILMYEDQIGEGVLPGSVMMSLFKDRYQVPDESVVSMIVAAESMNSGFIYYCSGLQEGN